MSTAIHWFRRDLRLTDNTALNAAITEHDFVVPVYVVSEWKEHHSWCGASRQEFLCGCLESLARNLEHKGGRLIIRAGDAVAVLESLVREVKADAVYLNRDPDPHGRAVEAALARRGVEVRAFKDHALHERDDVLTASGSAFKVFTPYARAWTRMDKDEPRRAPARIAVPLRIASDPLPTLATWGLTKDADIIEPGEAAARKRLGRFLDGPIFNYDKRRDIPAEDATSRLSQDLRWGLLSIREVYAKCRAPADKADATGKRSIGIYVNELIWREFYMQVLWHHPEVLDAEYQLDCRDLPWQAHWRPGKRSPGDAFEQWKRGETGFPIVDAGMRQLAATGFMHNRVRMIVAMFLTKDLRIWWMHGESWFMQRLVDGEIASNNGGWQWSASTGTDAAPYFRVQNPWSQTKRFDPAGEYIRRWVPELRDVPGERLCEPPKSPLAKGYPCQWRIMRSSAKLQLRCSVNDAHDIHS